MFWTSRRLDRIEAKIDRLLALTTKGETEIMADLTALTSQVAKNNDVTQSAIALINGLAQKISDAGTDPQKLADLVAQLQAQDDTLAAAVTANTPAAPATPPATPTT